MPVPNSKRSTILTWGFSIKLGALSLHLKNKINEHVWEGLEIYELLEPVMEVLSICVSN